jgi:hypothetical protein
MSLTENAFVARSSMAFDALAAMRGVGLVVERGSTVRVTRMSVCSENDLALTDGHDSKLKWKAITLNQNDYTLQ